MTNWNPRELPPEYYKEELEKLQRENAKLRLQKTKTVVVPWMTIIKWILVSLVTVGVLVSSARVAGPRGLEVAGLVLVVVAAIVNRNRS